MHILFSKNLLVFITETILNENQSQENQMTKRSKRNYINLMSDQEHLFFNLVNEVELGGRFHQILKSQQLKYHLHPFKISWINCQSIRKIYESLTNKSQNEEQPIPDPNTWNQNQRRVFIWFIIFYTYLRDISPTSITEDQWIVFSKTFFNKNPKFLQFHSLNMVRLQAKIAWTKEQDQELIKAVKQQESGKWNEVAKRIFYNSDFQIFKSPKHCRQRWLNHLDDKKKRGNWTSQQDLCILKYVAEYGKHWCKIVPVLRDTRTEHMIKNRYNSLINRQRKNKKERQEHLRYKLIKQLKKQISNAHQKKKAKELQMQSLLLKAEDLTPQQKIEITQQKKSQNQLQKLLIKSQQILEQKIEMNQKDIYPFDAVEFQMIKKQEPMNQPQKQQFKYPTYYQALPQPYYGYSYPPQVASYYYQSHFANHRPYWV